MRQNWAEAAASWSSGKGGEHSSSSCGPRITSTTQVYKRGTQRTIVLYRELGSRERISNVCLRLLLLLFGPQKLQKKKKGFYSSSSGAKESSMQKRKLLRYYLYSLLFCKAKKSFFYKKGLVVVPTAKGLLFGLSAAAGYKCIAMRSYLSWGAS